MEQKTCEQTFCKLRVDLYKKQERIIKKSDKQLQPPNHHDLPSEEIKQQRKSEIDYCQAPHPVQCNPVCIIKFNSGWSSAKGQIFFVRFCVFSGLV
jgi:hypothetical protein